MRLPEPPPAVRRSAKKAVQLFGLAATVFVLAFAALTAWRRGQLSRSYAAEEAQARTLALTYDALLLAPQPFLNKPVLWKVGCQCRGATTCYYEGDMDKPVLLPGSAEFPAEWHKGMSFCLVLARVQRVDPQGVSLSILEAKGIPE
jgi:hypothetical protein